MIIIITQQLVSRTCSSMMELIILVTLRAISASTQQPFFWFGFSTLRHASPLAVRVMRAHGTEIETTPSPPSGPESSDSESVYPEGTMVSFNITLPEHAARQHLESGLNVLSAVLRSVCIQLKHHARTWKKWFPLDQLFMSLMVQVRHFGSNSYPVSCSGQGFLFFQGGISKVHRSMGGDFFL